MTNYEPLQRGPHPAGVRTEEWRDEANGASYRGCQILCVSR